MVAPEPVKVRLVNQQCDVRDDMASPLRKTMRFDGNAAAALGKCGEAPEIHVPNTHGILAFPHVGSISQACPQDKVQSHHRHHSA